MTGGDVELTLGTTYVEPGVVAEDEIDGIILNVTSTNNINKMRVGSYNVEYTAKDYSGNESTATRKVNYNAALLKGNYYMKVISEQSTTVRFINSQFNKLIFGYLSSYERSSSNDCFKVQ